MKLIKLLLLAGLIAGNNAFSKDLLNASYDPTREFYEQYNKLFEKHWAERTGHEIKVRQSHTGSGKQARSVLDGLDADVVTLALAYDIDILAEKGKLLPVNWQKQLPHNSSPYTSTIVFLVRAGNPKQIRDWDDLVKPGVQVVTPNPKTSGGARWNYLAAWAYAKKKFGSDAKAQEFEGKLFKNVSVLDTGARGATATFVSRGIGDVMIAWENEAYLVIKESGKDKFQVVFPSVSILAEPPVAVVEKVATKKGNLAEAKAYLEYLYSPEAQKLAGANFYRPTSPEIAKQFEKQFPTLDLVTVDNYFGGWHRAQKTHFNEGGTFDQIMRK